LFFDEGAKHKVKYGGCFEKYPPIPPCCFLMKEQRTRNKYGRCFENIPPYTPPVVLMKEQRARSKDGMVN
jgi:hypothetical protein